MQITIGNGKAIHTAYLVNGNLYGSLCDPYVYSKGSRMRETDAEANCPRCAKATARLSQTTA